MHHVHGERILNGRAGASARETIQRVSLGTDLNLHDRVRKPANSRDLDVDPVAFSQREIVVGNDAGAGEEYRSVRKLL